MPAPSGDVKIGEVSVTGGTLPNIDRIAAGMRPGFRSCYARGLAANPGAEGEVKLTIRLGVAGQVSGVSAQVSTRVPHPVVSCLTTRAAATPYEVPDGGKGATILMPLTLIKP